ncbi:MAG: gliding motility-associated C-terminal domain-containing protein [Bacteroidota bacterium]
MVKILRFPLLLLALIASLTAQATHNRAGEITYVIDSTDFLTIIATITTYTKASSIPADRDSLEICWGYDIDFVPVCEWVQRSNGNGELLPNDVKKNLYTASHKYPGVGHYVLSMTDPNRNGGIKNVNPPSSDNVPFHLSTTATIFNPLFQGFNNSPILLQPPIDIACIGQPFIHNPNAFDADGDSLSYEMTVPLQAVGTPVPNYSSPSQFPPGANNTIGINAVTGDLLWNTPQEPGEYNVAIYIIEWRNGEPVDTMIRDMQILVKDCNNEPPEIETVDELCVVAGELISFDVLATDPDAGQEVRLTALGGPFIVSPSPAQFTPNTNDFEEPPITKVFTWQTTCEHISDQPYSVVFKAEDDFNGDSTGLATLKTVTIKVVGPPPEDVQAVPIDNQIDLSWEQPYFCEIVEDDFFKGFSVWRRLGSNQFPLDTCDPGLDGKGYTRLEGGIFDISGGRYVYTDFDVERGRNYCYRVLAEFAQTSAGGFSFNRVESLPSEEICVQLSRDIPLITNVSVRNTDAVDGSIFVQWSRPQPDDLDTLMNPGPYTYEVWRAEGITTTGFAPIPGASFTANNFFEAVDTNYIDTLLNTVDLAYSYRIAFYVNGEPEPLDFTNEASSTFLNIASTDETNILTWDLDVPWDNFEYEIYRQNGNQFDLIGTSTTEEYIDNDGLVNGIEYCYFVRGFGSYNIDGVLPVLINDSQENCGIPLDTIPPCPPELTITNGCDDPGTSATEGFENSLSWINPMNLCEETDDVVSYNIYYAPPNDSDNFQLIGVGSTVIDTLFKHTPDAEFGIAGCYAVTALDTFFNESAFSNIICIDNCPLYNLPNAFTPNGDGANELFIPYPYRFIDRIEINIFNIWGQLVFTSTDPDINWDGRNLQGKDVAEGVYYYTCRVFEKRVAGVTESGEILNGFIEIIRGD